MPIPGKVLFVTPEVAPYSKAGGLADVVGALPRALSELSIKIQVVSPFYPKHLSRSALTTTPWQGRLISGSRSYYWRVWKLKAEPSETGVVHYFISQQTFFDREGIYTDRKGNGYPDNFQRFLLFQRIVARLIQWGFFQPDLIHVHDHPTALLPWLLSPELPVLLTVHNFIYQGEFSHSELDYFPIKVRQELRRNPPPRLSSLALGVQRATAVNTVSPTYAREALKDDAISGGLTTLLRELGPRFSGILNGIDTSYWDPKHDPHLPCNYEPAYLSGKRYNKLALQRRLKLRQNGDFLLCGSVSRLVPEKGHALILECLPNFVSRGVQFVFLGSGMEQIARELRKAAERYPGMVSFTEGYHEELAHLIEAGSDVFLMPSRIEPCGLNQMYSLRYGTLPIVHETGGLADTVKDLSQSGSTGFVFRPWTAGALGWALERARLFSKHPVRWRAAMLRAMAEDFSWQRSAREYARLYEQCLEGSQGS